LKLRIVADCLHPHCCSKPAEKTTLQQYSTCYLNPFEMGLDIPLPGLFRFGLNDTRTQSWFRHRMISAFNRNKESTDSKYS
jgi:hypothetical protein